MMEHRIPHPHWLACGLVFGALTFLTSTTLLAQGDTQQGQTPPGAASQTGSERPTVTLTLTKGQRQQVRLAFPAANEAAITSVPGRTAAEELDSTLRQDLDWSGIFVLQGPDALSVADFTGDQDQDFEIYRSLGNEALLDTTLRQDGDRLVLEGRLYDLQSGRAILGKRYQGGLDLARRMAHTFADEIVRYFSGRQGIALSSIAFYSDRTGDREIYLMDYDGHNQRRITGHKTISLAPTWNPKRDEIAYVSFLHGPPGIFLVDFASGRKRPLVDDGNHNLSPSFSPDGSHIAFARSLAGNWEIFTCNRDGSDFKRLTHSSAIDTNPAWSPTGREIAFTSSRSGAPQIYVMDAEGANLRRVTFEGNYNDGAAWAPQGDKLVYASRRNGSTFEIVLGDLVTREERVLTAGRSSDENPSFSPDGRKIAFARTDRTAQGRITEIYIMNLDGTGLRRLTREGNNFAPEWSGYRQ
jgi:TolB protein